jgi:hypothetical protein
MVLYIRRGLLFMLVGMQLGTILILLNNILDLKGVGLLSRAYFETIVFI